MSLKVIFKFGNLPYTFFCAPSGGEITHYLWVCAHLAIVAMIAHGPSPEAQSITTKKVFEVVFSHAVG